MPLGFLLPGTGRHLVVDGEGARGEMCDPYSLKYAVAELVERIGMTSLHAFAVQIPLALQTIGVQPKEDEGGVSVIHVLSTSHVALHTWPECSVFMLDVYSCRDFRDDVVLDWAVENLGMGNFTAESWRR